MKKAFSLIELSIVILIIGILIAGVTQGSRLVAAMRLASARAITQSSPIASIKNLHAWYEPTSENSFLEAETEDLGFITTWKDIGPNTINKYNLIPVVTANQPRYISSCINSLPCLKFDGTDDYLANTAADITGTELTVFVVARRLAVVANAAIVSGSLTAAANDFSNAVSFIAFYEGAAGTVTQSYRGGVALSSATHPGNNVPFIASTTYNNTNNFTYLNGAAQASVASTGDFNSGRLLIGARWAGSIPTIFYNGHIAEIIIFTRALKTEERKSIESYLSKKWGIKVS